MNAQSPTNAFDSSRFREALGAFATGITIVTTRTSAGLDVGVTANSFNSVSLSPPMVLWSLSKASLSRPAFAEAAYFAVHVLSVSQEDLANQFARRGVDKFAGLTVQRGPEAIPLLQGCSARFQCRTAYLYEGGDHEIIVGEVMAFDSYDRPPLAFHRGRYGSVLTKSTSTRPAAAASDSAGSFSEDFLGFLLGRAHYQLFHDMRLELCRMDLSMDEFFVLCVLGFGVSRDAEDLGSMATHYHRSVSAGLISHLISRRLVVPVGESTRNPPLTLTPGGHQTMIELLSLGKAAEAAATDEFDYAETQLFKDLLRRLIRKSSRGLPRLKERGREK